MKKLLLFCILCLPLCASAQQNWKAVMRYDKQTAKADLTNRLTKYAAYDTQANQNATQTPSSKGQLLFAKSLAKELKHMGAAHVQISKTGVVTADIPATFSKPAPVIALAAHLDTTPLFSAADIKPQVHKKYKGGDILINQEQNLHLREYNNPQLLEAHGHDLITASGGTVLGADGKAGIAIIMTMADYLLGNPAIEHGLLKIAFTPDQTTGNGMAALDTQNLGADYAYSVNGSQLGEIITENFAKRTFSAVFEGRRNAELGYTIHSDFADNVLMASDFHTLLPRHRRPETTSGRNGFIYVNAITTQGDRTEITGEIYAFSDMEIQELSGLVTRAFQTVKAMNPKHTGAELTFQDHTQNAKTILPKQLVKLTESAMRQEDISPKQKIARRTTDAAILSFKGIPTIGIFSGAFGRGELEYADAHIMEGALRTLMSAISLWTEETKPQP